MVPEIKSILFATDLSENANYAFKYAVSLALKYEAKIIILSVLKTTYSSYDMSVTDLIKSKETIDFKEAKRKTIKALEKQIKDILYAENEKKFSYSSFVDKIIVEIGEPADAILGWVDNSNCDMLIMGARGLGIIMNALMGSTSRRVVRRCQKPVLVVRLPSSLNI